MPSEANMAASFIICAYNAAGRIGIPLASLARMRLAGGAVFELLVVDNNSKDGTAELVERHSATIELRAKGCAVRVLREERQGLLYARLRGLREARSNACCFVDDDVEVAEDFMEVGLRELAPEDVALLIPRISGAYEKAPDGPVKRRETYLAVNEGMGEKRIEYGPKTLIAPTVGAGMWLRRDAFMAAVPWQEPEKLLPDRIGKRLTSGGDYEFGILLGKAGYRRVYVPTLRARHHIPPGRLETRYFFRLMVGCLQSEFTLRAKYGGYEHTVGRRAKELAKVMVTAVLLGLPPYGGEGRRERLFLLAGRWAQFKGAY